MSMVVLKPHPNGQLVFVVKEAQKGPKIDQSNLFENKVTASGELVDLVNSFDT